VTDREQVLDLMVRYGRACDTKDWDLLASCFVPDAVIRYRSFGEEIRGVRALEEYLRGALDPLDATQHLFTNFAYELDGDLGRFRCSLQAQHVRTACAGGPLFTVGGTYEIDVARNADGWRIRRLQFEPIWMDGNPEVLEHIIEHVPARA
jgi:hypothetical protein